MTYLSKLAHRLARLWIVPVVGLSLLTVCKFPPARSTAPNETVAKLNLSPPNLTLLTDDTTDFVAVALNATDDTIDVSLNWTTSGGSIAPTSDISGRQHARYKAPAQVGTYKVFARSASSGVADSSVVDVTAVPVASVSVTPASLSLTVGQTGQLSATPRDASGNPLTGRVVTWTTNNAAVASVSAGGLVSAQGPGTATITATSEGQTGTAAITVPQPAVPVASVSVTPASLSLTVGRTGQLSATPRDANGNPLSGRVVTWTTNSAAVATVSASGLVTARGAGTATITATSEGQSGSAQVTVQLARVASVTVSPSTATIGVGLSTQLTATCRDSSGNILTGRTVVWTTSAAAVATVSSSGVVTVASVGTAVITANCEGPTATATITGVVVTANTSYPNEPAGATVLMDYDTDFGRITNPPWGYSDGTTALSTGTDPTAPVNPNVVGRVRFDVGCCNGAGPAQLNTYTGPGRGTPPAGWSQWYVSDWVKFDANFTPHPCCQKIFEFYWLSGGDKWLIVKADPSGTGFPAMPRLTAEFSGVPTVNLGDTPVIQAGRWYQYEIVVHRTGRVQLWIREQGGQPQSMFDGTISGFGNPSNEYLFWWWGYGGIGAYPGPTSYINHNHIHVSYTP